MVKNNGFESIKMEKLEQVNGGMGNMAVDEGRSRTSASAGSMLSDVSQNVAGAVDDAADTVKSCISDFYDTQVKGTIVRQTRELVK